MHRLIIAAAAAGTIGIALNSARSERAPVRAAPTHTVWDSVYVDSQAAAGEVVFHSQGCVKCHGESLTGTDDGAPLKGSDFLGDFENGTLRDIFDQIRNGMPPDRPKTVPRDQVTELVAFILSRNGFPAGHTALTDDTLRLSDIKVVSTNPSAVVPSNIVSRRVDTVRIGDTLRVTETVYIRGKSATDTLRMNDLKIFRKH